MAAIPKYKSHYGQVELAFLHNHNMMPVGLGPCSKCVDIVQRHHEGDRCWGTFESQWHLQGDTSMQCVQSSYNLTRFDGYYTSPQSDVVHVQDVLDDGASVATAQRSINKSLRWPDQHSKTGINVPGASTGAPSAPGYTTTGFSGSPMFSNTGSISSPVFANTGYVGQHQSSMPLGPLNGGGPSTVFSDSMWSSMFSSPFN